MSVLISNICEAIMMNEIKNKWLILVFNLSMMTLPVAESSANTTFQDTDGLSLHSSNLSNHFGANEGLTTDKPSYQKTHKSEDEYNITQGARIEKNNPSFDDAKALHTELMKDYIKYIRPVKNQTKYVDVYLSFTVYSLQELNELLERISVGGVFHLIWNDINMSWNESKHGGVKHIFVGYKDIWIPEIILSNPSDKMHSFGEDWQLIRIDSNGWATWAPGDIISAKCNLNHRYFPFDTQTCSLDLHVWAYLATEVKLIPIMDEIDTSFLADDSSWSVVKTSAVAWGDDWVSSVTYTVHLKRKPQYVIINVILPILFLCLLNVLVFGLPAESGERVSFAITVLLSIAVFMTIVSNTLPKSSDPVPLIAYFLVADLAMSSLVSVSTIWNLRLFYRNNTYPIPQWLMKIYNCCRWCRRKRSQSYDKSNISAFNNTNNNIKRISLMLDREKNDNDVFEDNDENVASWQDISRMFDIFFLIIFTMFSIVSFVTFFIITNIQ